MCSQASPLHVCLWRGSWTTSHGHRYRPWIRDYRDEPIAFPVSNSIRNKAISSLDHRSIGFSRAMPAITVIVWRGIGNVGIKSRRLDSNLVRNYAITFFFFQLQSGKLVMRGDTKTQEYFWMNICDSYICRILIIWNRGKIIGNDEFSWRFGKKWKNTRFYNEVHFINSILLLDTVPMFSIYK